MASSQQDEGVARGCRGRVEQAKRDQISGRRQQSIAAAMEALNFSLIALVLFVGGDWARSADPLKTFRSATDWSNSATCAVLACSRALKSAARQQPSLVGKIITPHVLRHTCAMELLRNGVDTSVIALWLGHEAVQSTQIYLHADMSLKERALARTIPPRTKVGRYRPSDALLAFLGGR